jgi:hypothetical protein
MLRLMLGLMELGSGIGGVISNQSHDSIFHQEHTDRCVSLRNRGYFVEGNTAGLLCLLYITVHSCRQLNCPVHRLVLHCDVGEAKVCYVVDAVSLKGALHSMIISAWLWSTCMELVVRVRRLLPSSA